MLGYVPSLTSLPTLPSITVHSLSKIILLNANLHIYIGLRTQQTFAQGHIHIITHTDRKQEYDIE